jgi:hypothetical protein
MHPLSPRPRGICIHHAYFVGLYHHESGTEDVERAWIQRRERDQQRIRIQRQPDDEFAAKEFRRREQPAFVCAGEP